MGTDPATRIQNLKAFGEFGGVNPSITDSSTYTFLDHHTMDDLFNHEIEGCFLYSRHFNPINKYLCEAMSAMEDTEAAQVTASGMAAITSTILQLCSSGDEVISGWTIYGGTFAFFQNLLPRFGVKTKFVDTSNLKRVEEAITEKTKVIYCESISNPLLAVPDLPALAELAHKRNITLVVDNTFSPMIITPAHHGADVIVHSLTKFVNGTSDCVAGVICSSKEFIAKVTDINEGACMLLGPVLDSLRAAGILKNLHSLHLRIKQHSHNALKLAQALRELGIKIYYPGLNEHPQHALLKRLMNGEYGFGGMLAIDVDSSEAAGRLMSRMQTEDVGYLAVSLGYFKTLFSAPAHSTSSEIPEDDQKAMGLSEGMIRLSVGLDNSVDLVIEKMKRSLQLEKII